MAQIPKGRLVENPHKPICRDCAVYFSITVSCPSIAGKTGKSVHTMHWGGPTISQIESWRVASEGTRNVDIVDIASGDQPMSASRKPKTRAMPPVQSSKPSLPHVRNVSCCILLKFHECSIMFYQPSPTITNHHQPSSTIINYLRLVKIIIDYLSLAILNKLPSLKLTANAPFQSVEWIHGSNGSNRISRSSTSTDRRSGRWFGPIFIVHSMCGSGNRWI